MVELIIVVTILVILATIWFLSFWNYPSQARDSVRKTDLENIKKALEIYKIKEWWYILPWNWEDSTEFQGWVDWFITEEIAEKLKISKVPTDPLNGNYYKYSVSKTSDSYKIEVDFENEWKKIIWYIPVSCEDIFKNGKFKWNWVYKAYSNNYKPIDIYCHSDFPEKTFYQEIIGWNMEREDLDSFEFKGNVVFSSEENFWEWWWKSLKWVWYSEIKAKNFTYVDLTKSYKISWQLKNFRTSEHAWVVVWFEEYDKDFKIIVGERVNILPNSETVLTRNVSKWDKKIYFSCDDELYSLLQRRLSWTTSIAYDVSEDLSDLPTKKYSKMLWNPIPVEQKNITWFLKRNWQECELWTWNYFEAWIWWETKIRFHYGYSSFNKIWWDYKDLPNNWAWTEVSWVVRWYQPYWVNYNYFRKWTMFIKPIVLINTSSNCQWNSHGICNIESTTYLDDLKLEILN